MVCLTVKEWAHLSEQSAREKEEAAKHSCSYLCLLGHHMARDAPQLEGGHRRDTMKDSFDWFWTDPTSRLKLTLQHSLFLSLSLLLFLSLSPEGELEHKRSKKEAGEFQYQYHKVPGIVC